VTLKIYNMLGQELATLVNKKQEAGLHEVEFVEKRLSSGAYFYRLQVGMFKQTKRFGLLK